MIPTVLSVASLPSTISPAESSPSPWALIKTWAKSSSFQSQAVLCFFGLKVDGFCCHSPQSLSSNKPQADLNMLGISMPGNLGEDCKLPHMAFASQIRLQGDSRLCVAAAPTLCRWGARGKRRMSRISSPPPSPTGELVWSRK